MFFENLINIGGEFILYFHNLSFDGEFSDWFLLENGYVYEEEMSKEKTFFSIIDESGSIYMINLTVYHLSSLDLFGLSNDLRFLFKKSWYYCLL